MMLTHDPFTGMPFPQGTTEDAPPSQADAYRMGGLAGMDQYREANPAQAFGAYDKAAARQRAAEQLDAQPPDPRIAQPLVSPDSRLNRTITGAPGPSLPEQIEGDKALASLFVPTSPLDAGLMVAGGPVGGKALRIGAGALGAMFEPSEAEAGVRTLGRRLTNRAAAREPLVDNWRLGNVADQAGYPPPTGSLNPLANVDVTFRGKQLKDFSPDELQAFGEHYGVKNLGPASPPTAYKTMSGETFNVPGGTEGTWTYHDLLSMKANPINPANVDRTLHAELQRKLGRTMTPDNLSDADVWNGLIFGLTSPNNPLFPNQVSASRLRLRTPEMLDDLASMIPWKVGDDVPKAVRDAASNRIAERYGLGAAPEGLGTRGSQNYTRVAELAQMFKADPAFFRKRPDEDWGQAVERIASQTAGLQMKTGSFGTVWQDPYHAAISAIDRHMAKEFEKRGGLFASPEQKTAWENKNVKLWNETNPERPVAGWSELSQQSGSDSFIGKRLLEHVGAALQPQFRLKSGEINPGIPQHLREADWVVEPKNVNVMGAAYKRALDLNQQAANESGLNLFMSQWMEWDRIRNRFEPHENMFPGLSKLPAPSLDQLRAVDAAHLQTGHKVYDKTPEGNLLPTKRLEGLSPMAMGYLGIGGLMALPAADQIYRPQFSNEERVR